MELESQLKALDNELAHDASHSEDLKSQPSFSANGQRLKLVGTIRDGLKQYSKCLSAVFISREEPNLVQHADYLLIMFR